MVSYHRVRSETVEHGAVVLMSVGELRFQEVWDGSGVRTSDPRPGCPSPCRVQRGSAATCTSSQSGSRGIRCNANSKYTLMLKREQLEFIIDLLSISSVPP
ncbi:hypothetical protein EYF80_050063 [Liparis tanakae]|uniref:Uncharacterized protein n=1 Tax=Liparis tanakae TaxID=230148 RepID=A0A4Z2FFQ1_9TELE|nr:hypothetical protein EYF80_050063 [Liparis tanakae]